MCRRRVMTTTAIAPPITAPQIPSPPRQIWNARERVVLEELVVGDHVVEPRADHAPDHDPERDVVDAVVRVAAVAPAVLGDVHRRPARRRRGSRRTCGRARGCRSTGSGSSRAAGASAVIVGAVRRFPATRSKWSTPARRATTRRAPPPVESVQCVLTRPEPDPRRPRSGVGVGLPPTPRLEPVTLRLVVVLGGVTIADTTRGLRVLETSHPPNYYFPPDDVVAGRARAHQGRVVLRVEGARRTTSPCGGGRRAVETEAAWGYAHPARRSRRSPATSRSTRADGRCFVDGELVDAPARRVLRRWITSAVVGPFKGGPGSRGLVNGRDPQAAHGLRSSRMAMHVAILALRRRHAARRDRSLRGAAPRPRRRRCASWLPEPGVKAADDGVLALVADRALHDVPAPDIVLVPGGPR